MFPRAHFYDSLYMIGQSAKRGLDAVTEFARDNVPGADIQRFGIAGASKVGRPTD